MQHLQEPTVAPASIPSGSGDRPSKTHARRKALTGPIALEVRLSAATAPQAEVIGDALRLLAIWAARVVQVSESAAPEAAPAPPDSA